MKKTNRIIKCLMFILTLASSVRHAVAQGTAFTYQGQLQNSGVQANGLYDFRFKLFGDSLGLTPQVGSSAVVGAVTVANGFFTTTVNFGAGIFNGSDYWLEVDVRTNNPANTLSYTELTPDQPITPAPYAIFATSAGNVSGTVSSTSLSGTYGNAINLTNANNSVSGSFSGNGATVSNVNAVSLSGLTATNFWQLAGNIGTTPGVNYVGTADNQPLEMHVNGARALRLEPGAAGQGAPNVIGGSPVNFVSSGTVGAFIGGGGATNYLGSAETNSIGLNSHFSVVGGGYDNQILPSSPYSFIGGGLANGASNEYTTVGGGYTNTAAADAATIGGGYIHSDISNAV